MEAIFPARDRRRYGGRAAARVWCTHDRARVPVRSSRTVPVEKRGIIEYRRPHCRNGTPVRASHHLRHDWTELLVSRRLSRHQSTTAPYSRDVSALAERGRTGRLRSRRRVQAPTCGGPRHRSGGHARFRIAILDLRRTRTTPTV